MEKQASEYKKFPTKKKNFLGNDCIWFGKDHLLLVESTGVSEDYKRFYFKDIQAINIMKTKNNLIKSVFSGILLVLTASATAGIYTKSSHDPASLIIGSVPCIALLVYLIMILVKGPSCKSFIYSSVQKESLTPVHTLKIAKKFLNRIIPEIEAAQGKTTPDILTQNSQRTQASSSAILKNAKIKTPEKISLKWHRILFLLSMCMGALIISDLLFPSPFLFPIMAIALILTLLANIIAIVKQAGTTLLNRIKALSITSLVFLVLTGLYSYFEFFFFMFKNMEEWVKVSNNQWEIAKLLSRINLLDYPILAGINLFIAALFFIMGILGLLFLWRKGKTDA